MFCFHLSSSCWVCFPCLSVSLTAFPNLFDYFILLFTPFSLTSYPPTLAPCISYFHVFSSLLSAFSLFFFLSLPFHFSLSPVSSYWLPLIVFCLITFASLLGFKAFVLYSFHPLHSVFLSSCLFSVISLICSRCFFSSPFLLCALSCHLLWIPSQSPGWGRGCSAPLMTSRSAKK